MLAVDNWEKVRTQFLLRKTYGSQRGRNFYLSYLENYATNFLWTKFAGTHKECRISVIQS